MVGVAQKLENSTVRDRNEFCRSLAVKLLRARDGRPVRSRVDYDQLIAAHFPSAQVFQPTALPAFDSAAGVLNAAVASGVPQTGFQRNLHQYLKIRETAVARQRQRQCSLHEESCKLSDNELASREVEGPSHISLISNSKHSRRGAITPGDCVAKDRFGRAGADAVGAGGAAAEQLVECANSARCLDLHGRGRVFAHQP